MNRNHHIPGEGFLISTLQDGAGQSDFWAVAFSGDGTVVGSGDDSRLKLWNDWEEAEDVVLAGGGGATANPRPTKRPRLDVQGHTEEITVLLSSADGRVISASFDSTLREWDPASGRCLGVYEGHSGCVNGFALHRDGRCIVSGSSDGSIKVWDRATRRCIKTLIAHPRQVRDNAETAAAAAVAAADDNAPGFVFAVALSPDGSRLFSGSGLRAQTDLELHAELKVWDFVTGKCSLTVLVEGRGSITGFAMTPDGLWLAVCFRGQPEFELRMWDVESSQWLEAAGGGLSHSDEARSAAFGRGGRLLAVGTRSGAVEVLEWRQRHRRLRRIRTLSDHGLMVTCLAFSPDERRLASGSLDRTVKVWDVAAVVRAAAAKRWTLVLLRRLWREDRAAVLRGYVTLSGREVPGSGGLLVALFNLPGPLFTTVVTFVDG